MLDHFLLAHLAAPLLSAYISSALNGTRRSLASLVLTLALSDSSQFVYFCAPLQVYQLILRHCFIFCRSC